MGQQQGQGWQQQQQGVGGVGYCSMEHLLKQFVIIHLQKSYETKNHSFGNVPFFKIWSPSSTPVNIYFILMNVLNKVFKSTIMYQNCTKMLSVNLEIIG